MNLLEHYITKVRKEQNVTKIWEEFTGEMASETMMLIGMDIDCYGQKKYVEKIFRMSEWIKAQEQGYYMA